MIPNLRLSSGCFSYKCWVLIRSSSGIVGNNYESVNRAQGSITAVFRSIGHTIFVPRERGLSITTYLRFDRAKISHIFFLIAFLGLIFLISYYFILQKTIGKLADGDSQNPAGLSIVIDESQASHALVRLGRLPQLNFKLQTFTFLQFLFLYLYE